MATGGWDAPNPRPYRFRIADGTIQSIPHVASLSNYSIPGSEVFLNNNHIRFNISGLVSIRANVIGMGVAVDNKKRLWAEIVKDNTVESTAYTQLPADGYQYGCADHGVTLYVTPSTDIYYNFRWYFGVGDGFDGVASIIEVLVF